MTKKERLNIVIEHLELRHTTDPDIISHEDIAEKLLAALSKDFKVTTEEALAQYDRIKAGSKRHILPAATCPDCKGSIDSFGGCGCGTI